MLAKNTSIALSKPYTDFISEKVKSGEFATSSEVVREAIRRYMDKEKQVQALRQALIVSLKKCTQSSARQRDMLHRYLSPRPRGN
jgi:putative addiction module CopG family antidote